MTDSDDTSRKHSGLIPWQPGQSGNPAGRPRGSRNKLGEAFIAALEADFNEKGVEAIRKVREDRPHEYLKVIAGIIPKEFTIADKSMDGMSDEELLNVLASVRSLIAAQSGAEAGSNLAAAKPQGSA